MQAKNENIQMQEQGNRFTRFKRFLNTVRAENLILCVYTAICCFLILVHEPWRDEAQFWLLARDASLPEILTNISREGIPPLWQLLIKPFVMIGLPYYPTMNIISTLLVAAAAWIFVKKAPFHRYAKYILLFSPVFIYSYATISRSYALLPLVIVLLAIVYPKRLQRPIVYGLLIALLFEVHVFIWGLVAALAIEFLISTIQAYKKDKRVKQAIKSLTAAIPLLIVALVYLIWFYPGAKASNTLADFAVKTNPLNILHKLFFGVGSVFGNTLECSELFGIKILLILLTFAVISIIRNKRWLKYVLIAGASILFEGIIAGFVYKDGNFRSISVFLILTFMVWLAKNDQLPLEIKLFSTRTTWVAVLCAYTFFGFLTVVPLIADDILNPYSNSRTTAAYIEETIPADSLILTSSNAEISSLSAYLKDYTFYDSEKEKPFTFYIWDGFANWESLYGVETNGVRQLLPDQRLYLVAKEAIARSTGEEDGFYYITLADFAPNKAGTVYWDHVIYATLEEQESMENYEILYMSFADANQLVKSYDNPA